MMKIYEMTNLGLLYHFVGMRIVQSHNGIFINQKKYALALLEKFGLKDCKPVSVPNWMNDKLKKDDGSEPTDETVYRQLVRSLLCITATRPYIIFAASL